MKRYFYKVCLPTKFILTAILLGDLAKQDPKAFFLVFVLVAFSMVLINEKES